MSETQGCAVRCANVIVNQSGGVAFHSQVNLTLYYCLPGFPLHVAGVYHCTDPVPAEPDWGIALRVSEEAEGGSSGGRGTVNVAKGRREGGESKSAGAVATTSAVSPAASVEAEAEREEVLTPPLLVPLQSGDAYFLLDDFK